MTRVALALLLLLNACGGSSTTKAQVDRLASPTPPVCSPNLQALEFAAVASEDDGEPVLDEDESKVDNLVLGLGLGSEIGYANWGPTGDLLVALSGCEEGECSAGVALIERNDHGFFVKKADTGLPSVLEGGVSLDHVFVANIIGDERPELWVVYSTSGGGDEREKNIAAYTLSGLKLLWSKTLGANDNVCTSVVYIGDLQCDGAGDVVVKRTCENAPIEEAQYMWRDGKLRGL